VTTQPAHKAREAALRDRDKLRDAFEVHGLDVPVNVEPVQGQRRILLGCMSPGEARKLTAALNASPIDQDAALRPDMVMWHREHHVVGVVKLISGKRVALRLIANDNELFVDPADLEPATLDQIDTAREAGARIGRRGTR
jgi:hypothetical protein